MPGPEPPLTLFPAQPYSFPMPTTVDPVTREIPDWLGTRSAWVLGPSWLLSAVVHVTFAWLVWQIAQSPGCQARRGEQVSENSREVGIFVREPGDGDGQEAGASPPRPETQAADEPQPPAAAANPATTQAPGPPVALSLPSATLPRTIGYGPPPAFATRHCRRGHRQ